jgi:hypothetical protein
MDTHSVTDSRYLPAFVTYGRCRSAYTVVRVRVAGGVVVRSGEGSPFARSRFCRFAESFTRLPFLFAKPEVYVVAAGDAFEGSGEPEWRFAVERDQRQHLDGCQ